MNTSPFLIIKDSFIFLWNHKRIMLAILLFSGAALAIATICAALVLVAALAIFGQEQILHTAHAFAAGVFPHLTPWLALLLGAGAFLSMLLIMFYPRVCTAYYVLSLLRAKPVTITQAFGMGFRRTVAAWRIVAGLTLFPLMVISAAAALILLTGAAGVVMSFVGLCALLWFLSAIYFVEQLVADGGVDFMAAIATSWNYVKRSWWQVLCIFLFLWMINMLCSVLLSAYIFPLVGFVMSAWYVIASNKIYLIARSESDYKYSSE